jgi:4'-phosphopantetheinyl transferase
VRGDFQNVYRGFTAERPRACQPEVHRAIVRREPITVSNSAAVEVWTLEQPAQRELERHSAILDKQDWLEIERIRHSSLRARAIACRAQLRLALTHALDGAVAPTAWRFQRTPRGKPFVSRDMAPVEFSVSHTEGLSVIAVSRTSSVGIDIETESRIVEPEAAASFLTRRELRFVRRLPEPSRQSAIVRLWTLKEAYAKLLGIGLAANFKTLGFDLDPVELNGGWEAADAGCGTRFETWSADGPRGRCHVALAIGQPRESTQPGKVAALELATEGLNSGEPRRLDFPGDHEVRRPDVQVICGVRTGAYGGGIHVPSRLL